MEKPRAVSIEKELSTSFMDYAMSVIIARALPDVRDGLKPVQRRILVTLNDLGLFHNKTYRKCAKISEGAVEERAEEDPGRRGRGEQCQQPPGPGRPHPIADQ